MRNVNGATVFAGLIALAGAAVAYRAVQYGLTGGDSPVGPGMFPAALGVLLCAAGIATAVADARRAPRAEGADSTAGNAMGAAASRAEAPPSPASPAQASLAAAAEAAGEESVVPGGASVASAGAAGTGNRMWRGFLLLAALAVAVVLGGFIGLIPAMTLYLFVVTHLFEELPLTRSLLYAVGGGVFLWAVFDQLLNVRFPGPGL